MQLLIVIDMIISALIGTSAAAILDLRVTAPRGLAIRTFIDEGIEVTSVAFPLALLAPARVSTGSKTILLAPSSSPSLILVFLGPVV
ncbi:hypothetical protein LZ30DRAFT_697849 [Colletotrichum cereale]|nr:hypothetical protein LZ30DRAFT_697849 [Colletotrichum cereale]